MPKYAKYAGMNLYAKHAEICTSTLLMPWPGPSLSLAQPAAAASAGPVLGKTDDETARPSVAGLSRLGSGLMIFEPEISDILS